MDLRSTSLVAFLALAATLAPLRPAVGQTGAAVEALAPVLSAEDAREWRPDAFAPALGAPDSIVRITAAMAVGRVGDARGVPLLLPLLVDRDSTVRVAAVFALGLIGDTAAVAPLITGLTSAPALDAASAVEAITSLARIGGRRVGELFAGILQNRVSLSVAAPPLVERVALESARLGRDAPVRELLPLVSDTSPSVRINVVYSLGRLRARAAGDRLVGALRDATPLVRAFAARALARAYVDSAGLEPPAVADLLARLAEDPDPGVRINAMRSLGGYGVARHAGRLAPALDDPVPNVRVQAAATLGDLGGPEAVAALRRALAPRYLFAVRREALLGLARADTAALREAVAPWAASRDWAERAVAAEAIGVLGAQAAAPLLADADPRVEAAALQGWAAVAGGDASLVAAARARLAHADAAVRSTAADIVGRATDPADIPALARAYAAAARDSFPDAALSALGALAAIARESAAGAARVRAEFLDRQARPASYLIRLWAESNWPAAAQRWGRAYPIETGRTADDYREIVRRLIVGPESERRPHVFIETERVGTVEVELLGTEAPLTVTNFLGLVSRNYFDRNRWHRVVPNFVVQDGDRRGDGWGSSGNPIRDEINRVRYDSPVLGMALAGPDTGSSQWFITLSPQPHIDGGYTVFGRVVGSFAALGRITQGDVIRTIRR